VKRSLLFAVAFVVAAGCAPVPTPRAVDDADAASRSPAALEAKTHAAQVWALAERRRLEAHAALDEGPPARAQFLAEEALATYQEGAALARTVKAARRSETASAESEKLAAELAVVDAALKIASADVEALELRLRVAQGAEPPGTSRPASPEREAARREAARGLLVQGRLLCGAARLLGAGSAKPAPPASDKTPEDPSSGPVLSRDLAEAEQRLSELDAALGAPGEKPGAKATPIDLATRARANCLSVLTRTRRQSAAAASGGTAASSADSLLSELGAMGQKAGFSPSRDERGVVVVLRDVFEGDDVGARAKSLLEQLDRVAAAHARFAVAVVVHTDKPVSAADKAKWEARAAKVASRFGSVPEARRLTVFAADALPAATGKNARNTRVEIVFIAPEAL